METSTPVRSVITITSPNYCSLTVIFQHCASRAKTNFSNSYLQKFLSKQRRYKRGPDRGLNYSLDALDANTLFIYLELDRDQPRTFGTLRDLPLDGRAGLSFADEDTVNR